MPITSPVSSDWRTELPEAVVKSISIQVGDLLTWEIEGQTVTLRKDGSQLLDGLLSEWESPEDDAAFEGL